MGREREPGFRLTYEEKGRRREWKEEKEETETETRELSLIHI